MNKYIEAYFTKLGACKKGIEFVTQFDSLKDAWNAIDRADWLMWWVAQTGQRENLMKVAIDIKDSLQGYKNEHTVNIDNYIVMLEEVGKEDLSLQWSNSQFGFIVGAIHQQSINAATIGEGYHPHSLAYKKQHALNLQIARKHLTFPSLGAYA